MTTKLEGYADLYDKAIAAWGNDPDSKDREAKANAAAHRFAFEARRRLALLIDAKPRLPSASRGGRAASARRGK